MSKSHDVKKDKRKAPQHTLEEKRAIKRAKQAAQQNIVSVRP